MEVKTYSYDMGFISLLGAIAVGITGIGVFTDISQMGGDAEKYLYF